MAGQPLDLAQLLSPTTREIFFDAYWEKKPLHSGRADPQFYQHLITIADLERMIASPEARYPAIQLSRGGAYFPPEAFTEEARFGTDVFSGVPNLQRINAEYRAGATVVMPALHRTWNPLAQLCARIESELNHVAHANAYLTPGNTSGFTPHYDTHEVLVLQIAGEKRWRIYAPPIHLPHRKQPFNPLGYSLPAKPSMEIDLAPGDLLYLPRGYIHTTNTSGTRSAHITVGIAVYTWIDLAGELLQSAMGSPKFRRALPPGFARADASLGLKAELAALLDDLRNSANTDQLIAAFLARLKSNDTAARGAFNSDVVVVQPDTRLEAPDPREYRLITQGTKVAVEYQGRRFILPADAQPALEDMGHRRSFTAADLPESLDLDRRLALVRTLLDKGFIKISREPAWK
jgi:ribosomal protein L16 Arg81 hydroxylase